MRSTRDFMQIPVRVPSWAGTPATAKKLKIVRDRFRHMVLVLRAAVQRRHQAQRVLAAFTVLQHQREQRREEPVVGRRLQHQHVEQRVHRAEHAARARGRRRQPPEGRAHEEGVDEPLAQHPREEPAVGGHEAPVEPAQPVLEPALTRSSPTAQRAPQIA